MICVIEGSTVSLILFLSENPKTARAVVLDGPPNGCFHGMVLCIRLNDMVKSTVYKEYERKGKSFTEEP
jgi:hypothetical protein